MLIEFEASDLQQDMWIKHAKASKNCRFVLQKKGHDFVQAVHEVITVSEQFHYFAHAHY